MYILSNMYDGRFKSWKYVEKYLAESSWYIIEAQVALVRQLFLRV